MIKKIFKLSILSIILSAQLFSASIKLKVINGSTGQPINDAVVIIVAFNNFDGEPIPEFSKVYKISAPNNFHIIDNLVATDAMNNPIIYKIGLAKQKYLPTIKEQISNPNIPTIQFNDNSQMVDLTSTPLSMYPVPSEFQAGILNVKISTEGIADGELFFLDLRHSITDEPVSFSIQPKEGQDSEGKFWLQIYNVPPAPPNTYRIFVQRAGTMEGAEVIVSTAVYDNKNTFQDVQLGFISNTRSESQQPSEPSNIAFEGIVVDMSSKPISNCIVEIRDTNNFQWNFFRTMTDASGKFYIFQPVMPSSYSVQISKLGYKSIFDKSGNDGYWNNGIFRRVLPKYFLTEATGTIKGKVKLNNIGLPDAWVTLTIENDWFIGLYPKIEGEGGMWTDTRTNGDGSFEFKGLSPGQYNILVNHPLLVKNTYYWKGGGLNPPEPEPNFSKPWNFIYNYNYGSDQIYSKSPTPNWDPDGPGPMNPVFTREGDDRRIVITSDTISSVVFSTSGVKIVQDNQSIDINLNVSISVNATIEGNLYFPTYIDIPENEIIKVIAHPIDPDTRQWLEHKGEGTVYYANPNLLWGGGNHKPILIEVSTGTYFVEIKSNKWVPVKNFNTEVVVSNPGDKVKLPDIYLTRAGRLEGKIKLPDGRYFEAKEIDTSQGGGWTEAEIRIRGIDVDYDKREEIRSWSQDPTKFVFEALPPGKYNIMVFVRKGEQGAKKANEIYPPAVVQGVRVSPAQATFLEVSVKDGVKCEPVAPIPPEKPEVDYSGRSTTSRLLYGILALPSDVPLKGNDVLSLLRNKGITENLYVNFLRYDYQNKIWQITKLPEGKYNFYMVMMRMFGPERPQSEEPDNSPDEYITVISRAENVSVKSDDLAKGSTFQIKMGAGVMGSGIFTGRVKGKKIFIQEDADRIKGNVNEFFKNLPTIMLYDMEGNWRAYGGVYPENNKQENLMKWGSAIMSGDVNQLNKLINSDDSAVSSPVYFYIDNLPLGKYVMVCETKNYPPVTKIVTISTATAVLNINFDEDAPQGTKLTGYVKDENGNPIKEANVTIIHRLVTKKVLTDSDGKFEVTGLPVGAYKIDVTKSGYSTGGEKVSLGKENKEVTIKLKTASAKILGKIYVRESGWSRKSIYTGAKVVAYNETENVTNPGKYLPSITVKTDNEGSYFIPDVMLGNTYYVYAFVPQRPVYYRLVYVSTNTMTNIDFDIKPSTPTLKIIMKRTENPYVFRFIIESPRPLVAVPECYYSAGKVFDENKKVRTLPTVSVKNSYVLDVEVPHNSDEEFYTLKVKGQYGMKEYMEEKITFSMKSLAKAKKEVADELAEGGAILIDDERKDNTEVNLAPGTITSEEMGNMPIGGFLSSLPNFKMSKTSREISQMVETAMKDIAASDVYEISLDKAQVNKSFDIAINYDRKKVEEDEIKDLKVYKYNQITEKWDVVEGATSVDPLTGTVVVEMDTLETTSQTKPAAKTEVRNGVFAIKKAATTSQTGVFAVFKQDPNTAKNYTGNEIIVYNFPNPFDLKSKTVVLSDVNSSANQTIKGTMIKYALPSDKGGDVKFYIYNLSGELVKTISEGVKLGGKYWYTEWDGTNDNNENCASGVYFMIIKIDGKKVVSKPIKMAIVK